VSNKLLLTSPTCCNHKSKNLSLVHNCKSIKNIGRTTTFLTKPNIITICKRNYPGNGTEKFVKVTAEKCIGTGCQGFKNTVSLAAKASTIPRKESTFRNNATNKSPTPHDEDNPKFISRKLPKDSSWVSKKVDEFNKVNPGFTLLNSKEEPSHEEIRKRLLVRALDSNTTNSNVNISAHTTEKYSFYSTENKIVDITENFQQIPVEFSDLQFTLENATMTLPRIPSQMSSIPVEISDKKVTFVTFSEELASKAAQIKITVAQSVKALESILEENTYKNDFKNSGLTDIYLKQLLSKYEDYNNVEKWTIEKKIFLDDLKIILENYKQYTMNDFSYITRASNEFKKLEYLFGDSHDLWKGRVFNTLLEEPQKVCYTLKQYSKEIDRCSDSLDILKQYYNDLPEPIFHEIIRRIGVIINNDAMYKDDFGKTIVVIEGEGSSLHRNIYKHMSDNSIKYLNTVDTVLNTEQYDFILNTITRGDYFIGQFNYEEGISIKKETKFMDSGEEIHMHLIVKVKINTEKELLLSVGNFTSNKDVDTIKITDKQYIDVLHPTKKEQFFRAYKNFVQLEESQIVLNQSATLYAKNKDCGGINVQEVLVNCILNKFQLLKSNPIREPYLLTRDKLHEIALEMYENRLLDLKRDLFKLEHKLNNMPTNQRNIEEKLRQQKVEEDLKEQQGAALKRTWPEDVKKLDKIKSELEQQENMEKIIRKSENKRIKKNLTKENFINNKKNE
jgi:hypothetical protein